MGGHGVILALQARDINWFYNALPSISCKLALTDVYEDVRVTVEQSISTE